MKLLLLFSIFVFSLHKPHSESESFCVRKIKQPEKADSFKVYYFDGLGYVVGQYEEVTGPNGNMATTFVRLVFDPTIHKYYPWPSNQPGRFNTIWEQDSCKAKRHWFNYESQWEK